MKTLLWSTLLLCAWSAASQETADLAGTRGRAAQEFSLAESHFLRGENQKALETYIKARELFRAAGDPLGEGHAWEGEAGVLFRLGDDHQALVAYRHARELFQATGDQLGQGDTWRGEAKALLRLAEDQKEAEDHKEARAAHENARQHFRVARQQFLATGEQLKLAHAWYGEAESLYWLSENKDEEEPVSPSGLYHYRMARKFYLAAGNKLGQGNTWRGEADVLMRRSDTEKALDSYEKALGAYKNARQLFMAVGDYEGQGDTWFREAQAWFSMAKSPVKNGADSVGRLRKANKALAAAIAEYQNAGVGSKQITTWLLKAEVEAAAEAADAANARALAKQAMVPVAKIGPISVGVSLVELVLKLKKPHTRSSEEAIRLHGILRETETTEADRIKREREIRRAYDLLVTVRARQKGKAAEALRLAEEARSRVLLDLLATPPHHGEMPSSADVTAERLRLEAELSQIEEQLHRSPPLEQQQELLVRRLQLELKWNAAGKKSFPQELPLDTAAIQSLARETGPLLVYYVTETEVWGFLIGSETAEIYQQSIPISRSELEQTIGDFVYDLVNESERKAEARALKLWGLLIDPFLEQLPKSGPLVILPHGPLHELPFEALRYADGKRLFERWQISIAPSVSALAFARSRHAAPLPDDSFLGFSSGRGLNLPPVEAEKISRLFGNRQTAVANYPNYEGLVARARHLLISTNGKQRGEDGTETYLEIEPTPGHDSRLTAAEIAAIPLKKTELVTLAACYTSHGKALPNDERLDVTRSFLIAGATAVLAARWKVPEDVATSDFLADFYQAYRQGGPQGTGMRKDEALTEARRRSRERGDLAQVWAGWVLIGDAR